jgi:SM-20-related protein
LDNVKTLAPFRSFKAAGSSLLKCLPEADEAPYYRISNFLSQQTAERILQDILERRDEFRARGINASGAPTFYRMNTAFCPCAEFLDRFEKIVPALQSTFGTDLTQPQLELLAQAYNDESCFGKHSDANSGGSNWQRRLSGIYYLHTRPRKFEGGSLAVYDRRGAAHFVNPEHNSAVFFPRETIHEVLPVSCASKAFEDSRFAINVWIS